MLFFGFIFYSFASDSSLNSIQSSLLSICNAASINSYSKLCLVPCNSFKIFSCSSYLITVFYHDPGSLEPVTQYYSTQTRWCSFPQEFVLFMLHDTDPIQEDVINKRCSSIMAMDGMLLLNGRWTDPGPAWPLLQVLKKDNQEFVARSYWDVLRRSASQVLFSDLAEVHISILTPLCCPFLVLLGC